MKNSSDLTKIDFSYKRNGAQQARQEMTVMIRRKKKKTMKKTMNTMKAEMEMMMMMMMKHMNTLCEEETAGMSEMKPKHPASAVRVGLQVSGKRTKKLNEQRRVLAQCLKGKSRATRQKERSQEGAFWSF